MTDQLLIPELIISLSHDRVSLQFLGKPDSGIPAWQSGYPVKGLFWEEEIGRALDSAMHDNPDLLGDFSGVKIILLDRPQLSLPAYLHQQEKLSEVAARYLRINAGDIFVVDESQHDEYVCYTMPSTMLQVINEYYHTAAPIHLMTLLLRKVMQLKEARQPDTTLFCSAAENGLFIFALKEGKLIFSKNFRITQASDIEYFVLACIRLLKPRSKYHIRLSGQHVAADLTFSPHFSFDRLLDFPSLAEMISSSPECES